MHRLLVVIELTIYKNSKFAIFKLWLQQKIRKMWAKLLSIKVSCWLTDKLLLTHNSPVIFKALRIWFQKIHYLFMWLCLCLSLFCKENYRNDAANLPNVLCNRLILHSLFSTSGMKPESSVYLIQANFTASIFSMKIYMFLRRSSIVARY